MIYFLDIIAEVCHLYLCINIYEQDSSSSSFKLIDRIEPQRRFRDDKINPHAIIHLLHDDTSAKNFPHYDMLYDGTWGRNANIFDQELDVLQFPKDYSPPPYTNEDSICMDITKDLTVTGNLPKKLFVQRATPAKRRRIG